MKLGPFTIRIEVSREPCRCGAATTKATIPVPFTLNTLGDRADIHVDTNVIGATALQSLACPECEL